MGSKTETDYRITKGTGWLEIGGCGGLMFLKCGINPEVQRFCLWNGVERIACYCTKLVISYVYENDVRFLEQFKSII
jgi:phenylalanyl-tRNA synthetase alpha chain